jgi:hypothetical protein
MERIQKGFESFFAQITSLGKEEKAPENTPLLALAPPPSVAKTKSLARQGNEAQLISDIEEIEKLQRSALNEPFEDWSSGKITAGELAYRLNTLWRNRTIGPIDACRNIIVTFLEGNIMERVQKGFMSFFAELTSPRKDEPKTSAPKPEEKETVLLLKSIEKDLAGC